MDRAQKAVELFKSGCNCSQAVVCAFCDLFGIDETSAMRLSEGMGGGMGRMRLTCGAVSGMSMVAGMALSDGIAGDTMTRKRVYEAVQKMAGEFKDKNGSVICSDLLGNNLPKDGSAEPTKRTESFYKKRPCIGCIEDCANIIEKYLIEGCK